MTLTTVLSWSIARALLLSTIAIPLAVCAVRRLKDSGTSRRSRVVWTCVVLMPLFVPDLLIGFSYRLTSMKISDNWVTTEALYAGQLLCRILALQVLVFLILPGSAMNAESLYSWKLLSRRDIWWRLQFVRMLWLGPWRTGIVAFIASALLTFQEFETAALIQINQYPISFPVWLFDAHAAGEPLSRSLRFIGGSVLCQAVLLLPLLVLIFSRGERTVAEERPLRATGRNRAASGLVLVGMCLVVAVWPLVANGQLLVTGLTSLATLQNILQRGVQVMWSLVSAAVAAWLSLTIARWLKRRNNVCFLLIGIMPGLCGSLVLSLLLVALFQTSLLRPVYDSPVPLILGQTLLMLPRAVLLSFLLEMTASSESRYCAKMLRGADDLGERPSERLVHARELRWQMKDGKRLAALMALTHWSLWDVTTASMLRSVRFEPIVTRLYNEMHYGRSESLIALTAVTLLVVPFIWSLICFTEKQRRSNVRIQAMD